MAGICFWGFFFFQIPKNQQLQKRRVCRYRWFSINERILTTVTRNVVGQTEAELSWLPLINLQSYCFMYLKFTLLKWNRVLGLIKRYKDLVKNQDFWKCFYWIVNYVILEWHFQNSQQFHWGLSFGVRAFQKPLRKSFSLSVPTLLKSELYLFIFPFVGTVALKFQKIYVYIGVKTINDAFKGKQWIFLCITAWFSIISKIQRILGYVVF